MKYEKREEMADKRLETREGVEHVGSMVYMKDFGLYSKVMGSYTMF